MRVFAVTVPIFTTNFNETIERYETLIGIKVQTKFEVPNKGISVAKIGEILIIGGNQESIDKLKQIKASLIVDNINDFYEFHKNQNALINQEPTITPTGKNMIVTGIDGLTFEYIELNPR